MMKIAYKKKYLNINLILGLVWLVWFLVSELTKEHMNWTDYAWLVISVAYLSMYYYQRTNKYLSIEHGIIKINHPFGKKLTLSDVNSIKKFAGDYILKTEYTKLTINTLIIEPKSLSLLNTELEKLEVQWS